jgi:hypothetical protein
MREIEIHDYARQLLEAHGAQAIAEAAQNAISFAKRVEFRSPDPSCNNQGLGLKAKGR